MNHKINTNYLKLPDSYVFVEINDRIDRHLKHHPDADLIRMGIGDVSLPLPDACLQAMAKAVEELGHSETMHGYGPEVGHKFLRERIAKDYRSKGLPVDWSEVFISDGAGPDASNIVDIFDDSVMVAVTDPVYPAYIETNAMAGRCGESRDGRWTRLEYLPCNKENGFIPPLPSRHVDLLYLCYPNNPTGTVLKRADLQRFVDYALAEDAVILFDGAYEAYIREEDVPHSIYELEGADRCAIEFRSFSKSAGFTGVRCGYTVVPHALKAHLEDGSEVELNRLWARRQGTKFNGASYISQVGATASYLPEAQAQIRDHVDYYLENCRMIRTVFAERGMEVFGGISAPYIWIKTPESHPRSWDFFQYLLEEKGVVGTPGVGFGPEGEGYFRLSGFSTHELTERAMKRILG